MLVFVSNLHLTDGTLCPTLHPGAIYHLVNQVQGLATRAGWRTDERYRPIKQIDLVFLGDCLDLITSSQWLSGSQRPWNLVNTPHQSQGLAKVLNGVLHNNSAGLDLIAALSDSALIKVPPSKQGIADHQSDAIPVSIRTHLLTGDKERLLSHPNRETESFRKRVVDALGLSHNPALPFPVEASESPGLHAVLRRHRVIARHGHCFDPLCNRGVGNHSDPTTINQPSISELLIVELLGPFLQAVSEQSTNELSNSVTRQLPMIYHVQPIGEIPSWIETILIAAKTAPEVRQRVGEIWMTHVERVLASSQLRLATANKESPSVDEIRRVLTYHNDRRLAPRPHSGQENSITHSISASQWSDQAFSELELQKGKADFVIYGHAHLTSNLPLGLPSVNAHDEPGIHHPMLFNMGTWQSVFTKANHDRLLASYACHQSMRILAFYRGDERAGRPFESIESQLASRCAMAPSETSTHQPNVQTAHQTPAPHFSIDRAKQRFTVKHKISENFD